MKWLRILTVALRIPLQPLFFMGIYKCSKPPQGSDHFFRSTVFVDVGELAGYDWIGTENILEKSLNSLTSVKQLFRIGFSFIRKQDRAVEVIPDIPLRF